LHWLGGFRLDAAETYQVPLFRQRHRFSPLCTDTLNASFNSLMSPEIPLLFKINSLFRVLGDFPKKRPQLAVVSCLANAPKSTNFPVFSLMIREFQSGEQYAGRLNTQGPDGQSDCHTKPS
jgi:hypothetical protein